MAILKKIANKLRNTYTKSELNLLYLKLLSSGKTQYECPVCKYTGPFVSLKSDVIRRENAQCPKCLSCERHRLQYLVLQELKTKYDFKKMKMLHFAPEKFFMNYFKANVGIYETADLFMKGVDHKVDMTKMVFDDNSYDFIFASHVLEHIVEDSKALSEISRILKPNGIAILPVPVLGDHTVEYGKPNKFETFHVRAPGKDYYQRYINYFHKVDLLSSESFDKKYQLFICEDRMTFSSEKFPDRPRVRGTKHLEIIPICKKIK
jgi:predicted SAM-dependent methyltransferase